MFKYYLMGNVYKDKYIVNNRYFVSEYRGNPFEKIVHPNYYGFYMNNWEYNLTQQNIELILNNRVEDNARYCSTVEKYKDEIDFKNKHKVHEQNMITIHNWDRYEDFNIIETDIELRDGETVKIDDKDYKVLYKYNKNLERHELYINYETNIEVDEELKKQCKENLTELNTRIEEYNKSIDRLVISLDERFENYVKSEDGGILNKIKSWFTIKHE